LKTATTKKKGRRRWNMQKRFTCGRSAKNALEVREKVLE